MCQRRADFCCRDVHDLLKVVSNVLERLRSGNDEAPSAACWLADGQIAFVRHLELAKRHFSHRVGNSPRREAYVAIPPRAHFLRHVHFAKHVADFKVKRLRDAREHFAETFYLLAVVLLDNSQVTVLALGPFFVDDFQCDGVVKRDGAGLSPIVEHAGMSIGKVV